MSSFAGADVASREIWEFECANSGAKFGIQLFPRPGDFCNAPKKGSKAGVYR